MANRVYVAMFSMIFFFNFAIANWYQLLDENAVAGSSTQCVNDTKPYFCLGSFPNATICSTVCQNSATCDIWVWSGSTHNCWTRNDHQWSPQYAPGITSGCNTKSVPNCGPPAPPYNGPIAASIDVSRIAGRTHPLSPAVTLDFWHPHDPSVGEKWGLSGAITINLSDPKLRALASAITPAILRIGGSPVDSIFFDTEGTCKPLTGGNGPYPNYYCSQTHPYFYDCLTPLRWNEFLEFGTATGLKIILGLNGCFGRSSMNASMDFSNIAAVFKETVKSPYLSALYGFEFTNEISGVTIGFEAWTRDFLIVEQMGIQMFTAAKLPVPKFIGPADVSRATAAIAALLPPNSIHAFTYHAYPQCTAPPDGYGLLVLPSCLANVEYAAQVNYNAIVQNAQGKPPFPPAWMGEGAMHAGGGIPNITDTFRSSFYYAYEISSVPLYGTELTARQCLSGGDYELLQKGSFDPNPDYFILWLFRNLVGGGASVFNVTQSVSALSSGVRVFAMTAAQNIAASHVLVVTNVQDGTVGGPIPISLNAPFGSRSRVEFVVTADPTVAHGTVSINGKPILLDPVTHLPPAWQDFGVRKNGGLLLCPPGSVMFVLI